MPYIDLFPYSDLYYGVRGKGWKKLTILCNVSEATVSFEANNKFVLNNVVWVPSGTSVTYTVSATGYDTVTQTITVTHNEIVDVTLELTMVTLTISPVPSSAIVTLVASGYEQIGNSITVPYGTEINYTVSATGYDTVTSSIIIMSDTTKIAVLGEEFVQPTLTENGTPGGTSMAVNWTWTYADQHIGNAYSIFEPNGGYIRIYREEEVSSLEVQVYFPKPIHLTALTFNVLRQDSSNGDAINTKLYAGNSSGDKSVLIENIGRVSVNSTAQVNINGTFGYFQYYTFSASTLGQAYSDALSLSGFLFEGKMSNTSS